VGYLCPLARVGGILHGEPAGAAAAKRPADQAQALGEVCGGPLLGLVGALRTVRTALVCAGVVLVPALPLCRRSAGATTRADP